jgi:hypothetical protein
MLALSNGGSAPPGERVQDMEPSMEKIAGRCHCGGVRFEAELVGGLQRVVRCTCTYCRMRGAVVAFTDIERFTLASGEALLSRYQFNTNAALHYFCSRCGIYTHHQRRLDPTQYAVNVACLDGVSPFDFEVVPVVDGFNHPLDHGGGALRVIGELRFVRSG